MKVIYIICIYSFIYSHDKMRCPVEITRDERPILENSYQSSTGHFLIHYDTNTENSPSLLDLNQNNIPDYIEQVGIAADSSRYVLTEQMGFIQETNDEDGVYDIYVLNLSTNLWGQTQYESGGSTFIKIRNSYQGMSNFCEDSNQLLWLTVAHEFFHAIQYSYKASFNDSYFRELSSMWFENIFVPSCFDFLDFVDMSSNSLFNNPDRTFDYNTSGTYGYSLSLFAHYLSTIIDVDGSQSQLNSKIIRDVWERYSESPNNQTIFQVLKEVLVENHETTFSYVWGDFMSRNMYSGIYDSMNNDIYYHPGLIEIDPPNFTFESSYDSLDYSYNISVDDDKVSFLGIDLPQNSSLNAGFSNGDYNLWNGILDSQNQPQNISGQDEFSYSIDSQSAKLFFMITNNMSSDIVDLEINVIVDGCTDQYADNYNEYANNDNGSCIYSNFVSNVFPNPLNSSIDNIAFTYISSNDFPVNLVLYNLEGRIIQNYFISNISFGENQLTLNIPNDLSSGYYLLSVNDKTTIPFINVK
ncbi:MAG: hypothetical protein CBD21_05055 [bacterium TMED161]|nr:MAG: hypothetical protein CBD21_05055 [bacterium TMED161]